VEGRVNAAVREMGPADHAVWAGMAHALWPEVDPAQLRAEIDAMAGPGIGGRRGWIAEAGDRAVGFAELGLRPYANGCESQPVGFLEAIWVAPDWRGRGVARALLAAVEAAARADGLREIGSDALIDNADSLASHVAWGFEEVERVVCFRKALD
jgi:aminoglycoside 6'-N-acetyltransferase I